jgi:Polyketide cyclase / dehydrase and lipid transport
MRWILRIVYGLVAIVVILALASYLLPGTVVVSRSIVIDAPAKAIWPYVSDLKRYNDWQPWAAIDPDGTSYVFEGPDSGVGQIMHWTSEHKNVGSGTQKIVAIDPDRSVDTSLDFGDMGTAEASLTLTPVAGTDDGRTEVTWGFKTDLGLNPIERWFGLMFDRWVGNDYEAGLKRLKSTAEAAAAKSG